MIRRTSSSPRGTREPAKDDHLAAGGGRQAGPAVAAGPAVPYAWSVPERPFGRGRRPPLLPPSSSSGLGHRPFKAAARVRIPLGAREDGGHVPRRTLAGMANRIPLG